MSGFVGGSLMFAWLFGCVGAGAVRHLVKINIVGRFVSLDV